MRVRLADIWRGWAFVSAIGQDIEWCHVWRAFGPRALVCVTTYNWRGEQSETKKKKRGCPQGKQYPMLVCARFMFVFYQGGWFLFAGLWALHWVGTCLDWVGPACRCRCCRGSIQICVAGATETQTPFVRMCRLMFCSLVVSLLSFVLLASVLGRWPKSMAH